MNQEVTILCGRYDFNTETKKVVMVKAKGFLSLTFLNDENELWVRWYNQDDADKIEIERVLFKGSTIFEKVKGQNRVYLLKITDDNEKYFFWMQNPDPQQDELLCKQFNDVINKQILDDQIELEQQPTVQPQSQPQPILHQQPQQGQQSVELTNQLLQLLQQQLQQPNSALTLNDILTSEFLLSVASDPEYFEALKQHLPEDQQNYEQFKENLLSPQFKQALEQLSHALKGRERNSVIQQLELDPRILEREFDGVVAFVKAIMQQIKKQ